MTPEEQLADLRAKNAELTTSLESATKQLTRATVTAALLTTPFAKKLHAPADMIAAAFADRFKLENGKPVAYDANGTKLYSMRRPGELADVDEALQTLVSLSPHRRLLMEGPGSSASKPGAGPIAPLQPGSKPTYTRKAFEALTPAEKAAAARSMSRGECSLID